MFNLAILRILCIGMMLCGLSGMHEAFASEFSASAAQQNTKTVSGVVKDAATGESIIGASIVVKGTTIGTVTDLDGTFTLDVPADAVVEVSCIGYSTVEVSVAGKTTLNVALAEDARLLEEVVVMGYGAQARKQDLSASVGVISNTETLATRPVSSTSSMLQGQLAGVTVQANGGDPTSSPSVVIRGQGSQNGDSVLWVVDGVPGAPITSMNEIESIVVLKDAASAAIYGAQSGAGGVILVTTKKAKKGQTSVTYDGVFGIRQATNLIEPLNAEEQLEMRKLSYANAGMTLVPGWDETKNPWIATTRTNWMDEIFRTAFYQRHNVALAAGTENSQHRLSFSYDNDEGVLIGTYNQNLSVRYNGSYKINDWITISEDLVWKNNSGRSTDTSSGYTGSVSSALYMPASATVYSDFTAGGYGGTTTEDPAYIEKYGSNYGDAHADAVNPVRLLMAHNQFSKSSDLWSTTKLELGNIVPGLKFVSRFTFNLYNSFYKNFNPIRDEIGKPEQSNTLSISSTRNTQWETENTLTYDKTFGKHQVGALVSTTADYYSGRGLSGDGKALPDESTYLQYIDFATSKSVSDWMNGPDANVSVVARGAYSYDDRYFVTASWRRDYAGRLPDTNNYGDFPAVTAGWKLSSEPFFPESDQLNLLKIRASWGRVGNLGSIGMNYKSSKLSSKNWVEQAQYGPEVYSTWGKFYYISQATNPNLTWETSEQLDLGIDLEMFNNRLSVAVDYFDKRTFNLIQGQTMNWPETIGLDAQLVNQGEIKNRGVEVQAAWNHRVNNDWSYYVSGNFSYLKNWVSDIGVKDSDGNPGVWTGGGAWRSVPYVYQTAEGEPLNSYYLIATDGIFQSDAEAAAYVNKDGERIQPYAQAGDLKFVDYNGDGKISDDDRQYMGNATPTTTFALSAGFTWKNLSVSAMFQGVGGAQAFYVAKQMILSDSDGMHNRGKEILNAWSPENTDSNIPRLSKNDLNENFSTASDWYLEDASYLRLKNFQVSYDLTSLLRKGGHFAQRNSSLLVYFSGENLFTLTKYSGMDPEVGGYDAMKYPVSRVLSLGVKLTY